VEHHEVPGAAVSASPGGKVAVVKSASRALDILEALAAAPDGVAFSDLARLRGIPKSSLHALLTVLTDRGYVEFDAARRTYELGIRPWELGQAWRSQRNLIRKALPVMEQVVEAINETVQLAVLDGIENVYLAKVDCSHPLRLQSEVGKRLYAHATGLGKVLLASLGDAELDARFREIPFPLVATSPLRSLSQLLDVVAEVRSLGFAVDDQEYTPGLRCVAVPVYDIDNQVIAALSASIPLMRAHDELFEAALRQISLASIAISRALGSHDDDPRLAELTEWRGDVFAAAHE
jgi:DNA-binding IclR family transcriptional regulator